MKKTAFLLLGLLLCAATAYAGGDVTITDKECGLLSYGIYCKGKALNTGTADVRNVVVTFSFPLDSGKSAEASDMIDYLPAGGEADFAVIWSDRLILGPGESYFTAKGKPIAARIRDAFVNDRMDVRIDYQGATR